MQQIERDLFGNPIESNVQQIAGVVTTTDFNNADSRTPSDDWRSRREEEPERWDGMS